LTETENIVKSGII